MTDRSFFDRPAQAAAILFGVVLIAASAPFTAKLWGEQEKTFILDWGELSAADADGETPGLGEQGTVTLDVTGFGSSLVVTLPACADSAAAPAQPTATVSWTLSRGSVSLASGEATCAEADGYAFRVELSSKPTMGERSVPDRPGDRERGAARTEVWAAYEDANATSTYTLTHDWSRPAGPAPLPGLPLDPTLDYRIALEAFVWDVALNPAPSGEVR
ncbi:MAG TPA: hypothetical protein VI796_00875 [Candidatus Thermoplasmatota archaeon]|nr:hypothetical protein [Candidatus Thermoplasmatota archaeon]